MNLISQILSAERVFVDIDLASRDAIFEHVAQVFAQAQGLSAKAVVAALVQREQLGSTGLGQAVAIPHGRIKGLKQSLGAFVRLKTPVDFSAPDGNPVNLIFVMLVPEQANESHLRLLSELAQMFSDRAFREKLCAAVDATDARTLFANWNPNAADERSATL